MVQFLFTLQIYEIFKLCVTKRKSIKMLRKPYLIRFCIYFRILISIARYVIFETPWKLELLIKHVANMIAGWRFNWHLHRLIIILYRNGYYECCFVACFNFCFFFTVWRRRSYFRRWSLWRSFEIIRIRAIVTSSCRIQPWNRDENFRWWYQKSFVILLLEERWTLWKVSRKYQKCSKELQRKGNFDTKLEPFI